ILPTAETAHAILDYAAHYAVLLGREILVLHPWADPLSTTEMGEVLSVAGEQEIKAAQENVARIVAALVDDWAQKHTPIRLRRHEKWGCMTHYIAACGAEAALIIAPASPPKSVGADALDAALFETDRPMLVVPNDKLGGFSHLAVGWKTGDQWRDSVEAGQVFLAEFSTLTMLHQGSLAPGDEQAARVAFGGLPGQINMVSIQEDQRALGEILAEQAVAARADMLLIQANRHHKIMQWFTGSDSRSILANLRLPLLILNG
ncbi:MAG: hypothetical protein B7X01_01860, partial [Acidiphilium sp. 21-62-4]